MAILAKDSGGTEFEKLPQGAHMAVCDMLVNLGTQKTEWQGQVKFQPKIYLRFQVPSHRVTIKDEDKPMVIGEVFTLSLSEKSNLRPLLESWRGRGFTQEELDGFDITKVLGLPCQLSITHSTAKNGKTYANITAAMPIPEGMTAPTLEGEKVLFESMETTPAAYDSLPKWLKEKVDGQEVETPAPNPAPAGGPNDEIPFAPMRGLA